ncbi:MAG: response regulator [Saprospiraceae bacterium]
MIRIAILNDDKMLVDSIARFLNKQPNFSCTLKAYSLGTFFEQLTEDCSIDIILLDISLSSENSLYHLAKIKRLLPEAKVVVMTGHAELEYLVQALQEGADSYYLKSSSTDHLIKTLLSTYEGGACLDPKVAKDLVQLFREDKTATVTTVAFPAKMIKERWELNRRELQVAEGLYLEKTYKEIAQEHNISLDTVRHYLKILYKKADVHNRTEFVKKLRSLPLS